MQFLALITFSLTPTLQYESHHQRSTIFFLYFFLNLNSLLNVTEEHWLECGLHHSTLQNSSVKMDKILVEYLPVDEKPFFITDLVAKG